MTSFQNNHKGTIVYQEVIHKNFQVMETFLKRFHQIFTKHDQFQQNLVKIAQKLTEHEQIMEQIKEDQRFGVLMIEKKITNLKNSNRQSKRMSRSNRLSVAKEFNGQQVIDNNQKQIITQLKFDSIVKSTPQPQAEKKNEKNEKMEQQDKIIKQYNQHIQNLKKQVANLKDKTIFLSSYTSILSDKIDFQNSNNIKSSLLNNIENTILKKQEGNLKTKFNQKQTQLLQFITSQLEHLTKKINQKIEEDFSKNQKKINSKVQSFVKKDWVDKQISQLKQKITDLALQSQQFFTKKEQTKKLSQLIDKKILKIENMLNSSQQFVQKGFQTSPSLHSPFVSQHNSSSKLKKSKVPYANKFSRRNSLKNMNQIQESTKLKKQNNKEDKSNDIDFSKQYLLANHVSKQFTKDLGYSTKKINKSAIIKNKKCQIEVPANKSTIQLQNL